MAAASGNASRVRVPGAQNRPTSRSPSSIPVGIAASSGAAALAGRPSDPLYGTISDSAPATSQAGSHCASSRPRTVRSLHNSTLPATVARTMPRARARARGARAGRRRRPSRVMTAAITSAPPAASSSQRTGTAASTTPPTPNPAIWVPAPVRLKTERPRT
jgi:hypothetical protein